jgi:hypothetical protein
MPGQHEAWSRHAVRVPCYGTRHAIHMDVCLRRRCCSTHRQLLRMRVPHWQGRCCTARTGAARLPGRWPGLCHSSGWCLTAGTPCSASGTQAAWCRCSRIQASGTGSTHDWPARQREAMRYGSQIMQRRSGNAASRSILLGPSTTTIACTATFIPTTYIIYTT